MTGTVYTETTVYIAPEALASQAPYQVAIITLDEGKRLTARVEGGKVTIGDRVELAEIRDGVHYFRKTV